MIFIKNGDSIDKLKHWEDVQKRESFHEILDLTNQKLLDVFGYYELPEKKPCGKKSCRTQHYKGYLVVTETGDETNLGHICGSEAFGIEFENQAVEINKKATYHKLLTSLKEAKANLWHFYQLKAQLEAGTPSLSDIAHRIMDMKDTRIIGRAAYATLKRMAGSGDGRVTVSRKRSQEEADLLDVMAQKTTENESEDANVNRKPQFENVVIGIVRHPESLLNDNDISLIYERDIKTVLEQLDGCNPDTMSERAVTTLGSKASRLEERFTFISDRVSKANILMTRENLKPLRLLLNMQKFVSNKDKKLFKEFMDSLPV
ncbi:hypothetical protein [Yersinia alsatica]|uniref:hypothetical protein n=1 Tax=Yersinia alsatica TaxID=2890317 RepID=UPI0011A3D51F|nr:hypothetical protein [Yersinia alsatica]